MDSSLPKAAVTNCLSQATRDSIPSPTYLEPEPKVGPHSLPRLKREGLVPWLLPLLGLQLSSAYGHSTPRPASISANSSMSLHLCKDICFGFRATWAAQEHCPEIQLYLSCKDIFLSSHTAAFWNQNRGNSWSVTPSEGSQKHKWNKALDLGMVCQPHQAAASSRLQSEDPEPISSQGVSLLRIAV